MRYEGMVFRPPSEARSLIIQVTIGCARNTCTFCSMYKDKNFRIRPIEDVIEDLEDAYGYYGNRVTRVFLADGDALVVPAEYLLKVLDTIHRLFPYVSRVSSYGAPQDVLQKTPEELELLRKAGLEMVYIGAESGSDAVLKKICKQATAAEIEAACLKLKAAQIAVSVTLISGIAGSELLEEHAIHSGRLITKIKPEYVSILALMLEPGAPIMDDYRAGLFQPATADDVAKEMLLFLENTDSEGSIFRSNHASNYIPLGGTLNKDTPAMIAQIRHAMEHRRYKAESWRGL